MESNHELDDDHMKFLEISMKLNIFFTIVFIIIGFLKIMFPNSMKGFFSKFNKVILSKTLNNF